MFPLFLTAYWLPELLYFDLKFSKKLPLCDNDLEQRVKAARFFLQDIHCGFTEFILGGEKIVHSKFSKKCFV